MPIWLHMAYFVTSTAAGAAVSRWCLMLSLSLFGGTLRASWGYGVHNMGLHVDPLTDPGPFVAAVVERAPIILLGQWSPIPAETAVLLHPPWLGLFWWAAVVLVGLLCCVITPLLLRDRMARFWAAGMIFATIPVCRDISDGSALDLCRHRCVRIARPVLGICVRQIKGRAPESLVAHGPNFPQRAPANGRRAGGKADRNDSTSHGLDG